MSPQSRARKKKSSGLDQPAEQGMTGFFKDVLNDFGSVPPDVGPLEVEALGSAVVGEWWESDGDLVGFELIDYTGRKTSPGAAALLAALRVLAPTGELREGAAGALSSVLGRGIPEPDWAAGLGEVSVGECWQLGDAYGESSTLLGTFGYGEETHGVLAYVEHGDGVVSDVAVVDNPEDVLAGMRDEAAERDGIIALRQITPARFRRLLDDGLSAVDKLAEVEVSTDFVRYRALAMARCRRLPEPEPAPEPEPVGDRDALVADFFQQTAEVADNKATRHCVHLLIDYGMQTEPHRPLRVSPDRLLYFLEEWVPNEAELTEEQDEALPEVVLGWAHWAGTRQGLPEAALSALIEAARDSLEGADADLDLYLEAGEEIEDPEELAELLDRRRFAVPHTFTEIGDEELELEPTDPEQRRLLVIGEHPEYHDALGDELGEAALRVEDGEFDAAAYLAMKVSIVDQLWDDEPPEVWTAASRLREQGAEREDILDRLVDVLAGAAVQDRDGDEDTADAGAEEGELRFDLDEYRQALAELDGVPSGSSD
ncbi:DUF1841 family protein [Amycolatopsis cihanbeyliensis]|uniref:Uncharacterized protein DUF1841 n=1 Tax=Amycolatopsis cihanbeyliensis TaxID=1128664 RepID=A0A542DLZ0_AMYCI|nr:DUF1841 family protein [Amycolatopsis cihanbeyliensis]TQJ04113.1 uncharacterized protein DUF1841 [Amycolatopsis cihanbeyliensis]